ncbi:MAG: universal stress protein [Gemmatimonadota bacterium]
MDWKPIVVGVDGSPESVRAAVTGYVIAQASGAGCTLVYAAPDYGNAMSVPELWADDEGLRQATIEHSRTLITGVLEGSVPQTLLDGLVVRIGRAPLVLAEVAAELGAGLILLGGKHHRGVARLFSGTIPHMVRTCDVPLMATDGSSGGFQRVLVAVDLSYAAKPTIEAGERFAKLFGAQLRVMHVVEPIPVIPGFPVDVPDDDCYRGAEQYVESRVWPLVTQAGVETVIRRGRSAAVIVNEGEQGRADLGVVGSHGKGWGDRLLIGSTSERLLHLLPTLTLVVPVHRPSNAERRRLARDEMPWEAGAR